MRRTPALVLLFLAGIMKIWCQETGVTLFVTSNPIRAQLRVDGSRLADSTPVLLRDLEPGKHRFRLEKEGFLDHELEIDFAPGEMRVLVFDLVERGVSSVFPTDKTVYVMGREEPAQESVFYFEQGSFTINREQGELYVDPLFPQQRLIDGLHIAIPIVLVFTSLLTVDAVFSPSDSDWPLPPTVLAAQGITVSMIGVDIALNLKKRKQIQSYSYVTRLQENTRQRARGLYSEAERLLEGGSLLEAADRYARLTESCPDSPLVPRALYRMAGIHFVQGENDAAARAYRRIIQEYPVAELYDKSQKTLADLLLQQGRYPESLEHLDAMVYFDPLYTPEEIDSYICAVAEQWALADPAAVPELRHRYEQFITRYPDSESTEEYRRKLAELESS
jgi:outer membrane protein assembly factor BamD (BamD/ComL family)